MADRMTAPRLAIGDVDLDDVDGAADEQDGTRVPSKRQYPAKSKRRRVPPQFVPKNPFGKPREAPESTFVPIWVSDPTRLPKAPPGGKRGGANR